MRRRTILAGAALLLLAGCGATKLDRGASEGGSEIRLDTVRSERLVGDLTVAQAAEAAERFLTSIDFGYGDRLIVQGGEEPARRRLAEALAAPGRSVTALAGPPDGRGLRLTLERTVATPPTCEDWSDPPTGDFSNLPRRNVGCATLSNLARMVADPNDLAAGRNGGRLDSQHFTVLIDAHKRDAVVITDYTVTNNATGGQ
ncbi:MAG: CpaD family pilus assembly protein [Alphaproteobacteria bacterium]|nr:CpaD family pilus assembly protein [Alphaproteobacteria bacterium]